MRFTILQSRDFNLPFTTYVWRPRAKSTILGILMIMLCYRLGLWQWDRYLQKIQWQTKIEQNMSADPLPWNKICQQYLEINIEKKQNVINDQNLSSLDPHTLEALRYQKVMISGSFISKPLLLLDNQIHEGQVGYHVLSLFKPEHHESLILVDRGFIPILGHRNNLPAIPLLEGKKIVEGLLDTPTRGMFLRQGHIDSHYEVLPLHNLDSPSLIRIQVIDFKTLSTHINKPLYPMILKLSGTHPNSFQVFPILFDKQANKHLGYTLQWFIISLVVLIYFLVINIHRVSHETNK